MWVQFGSVRMQLGAGQGGYLLLRQASSCLCADSIRRVSWPSGISSLRSFSSRMQIRAAPELLIRQEVRLD